MPIFNLKNCRLSVLLALSPLLFSGSGDALDQTLPINELVPSASTIGTNAQFGDCEISVVDVNLWRDFAPTVGKHNSYTSLPLMAKVEFQIANLHDDPKQLFWSAYIFNSGPENYYPMNFIDRTSVPEWTGLLDKWETRRVELTAHGGPDLPVGATAIIFIKFTDEKDQGFVWIRSEQVAVYETH